MSISKSWSVWIINGANWIYSGTKKSQMIIEFEKVYSQLLVQIPMDPNYFNVLEITIIFFVIHFYSVVCYLFSQLVFSGENVELFWSLYHRCPLKVSYTPISQKIFFVTTFYWQNVLKSINTEYCNCWENCKRRQSAAFVDVTKCRNQYFF